MPRGGLGEDRGGCDEGKLCVQWMARFLEVSVIIDERWKEGGKRREVSGLVGDYLSRH